MSSEPTTLEYRTATNPPRRVFSLGAFVVSGIVVAILAIDLIYIVPRCNVIFLEFAVSVPAVTEAMVLVSRWFTHGGWAILLSIPPAIGFVAARFENVTDFRRRRTLWALLALLFIAAIAIVTIVGMLLPLVGFIEAFTRGR
jgi:hypothetical protein